MKPIQKARAALTAYERSLKELRESFPPEIREMFPLFFSEPHDYSFEIRLVQGKRVGETYDTRFRTRRKFGKTPAEVRRNFKPFADAIGAELVCEDDAGDIVFSVDLQAPKARRARQTKKRRRQAA